MRFIDIWNGNWGSFQVPADVPRIFRNDGWPDFRYKICRDLQQYFLDMDDRMRDDMPILTWAAWKAGSPLWFWAEEKA